MTDQTVTILENRKINEKYFKLIFRSRQLARNVLPGQFMNIQIQPGLDPFLRRPFSYYRISQDKIEVLYEILGRGTALLASRVKGDSLKVMGPLGLPFTGNLKKKKRMLVAGGVGVPPLVFLAEKYPVDYFLIGTKSKKEVMPKKELAKIKGKIFYSTNDGSYGKKGFVTVLVEDILKKENSENLYIQTCGPEVMMQAVLDIARRHDIEGEASLDKPMACGVGACLGCMVKTDEGWQPSCTHGPVFPFKKLTEKI
ncbi:MAG: dihydroorotate dehydrogenase electron transfer subunit [Candidatus Omnitrophica bacterium]|nr:dihydroorotate dehydrogenase electron transfer subunit [Candidatus Omnitrophota bacterium]